MAAIASGSMSGPLDIFGRALAPRRLVVCTGPCCDGKGAASAQLEALRALLVARGLDAAGVGAGSCVKRACLGKCTDEPLAQVTPDQVWYRARSGADLLRIYEQHVIGRTPVAALAVDESELPA